MTTSAKLVGLGPSCFSGYIFSGYGRYMWANEKSARTVVIDWSV